MTREVHASRRIVELRPDVAPSGCAICKERREGIVLIVRGRVDGKTIDVPKRKVCSRCVLVALEGATDMGWVGQYEWAMAAKKVKAEIATERPERRARRKSQEAERDAG